MKKRALARLAMRAENGYWCAYYAPPDTMDGAILLGSIKITVIIEKPARREQFLALMHDVMRGAIKDACGKRADIVERKPASPHERFKKVTPDIHNN